MTVREAQERIDSREFAEWIAYDRMDPIGQDRADLRAALVSATVARSIGGGKAEINDFMLKFEPRENPKPKDWRTLRANMLALVKNSGRKRKGK
jgi:hypothetical protein